MTQANSPKKRKEISTLIPERRLRDIPGNLVKRTRRADHRVLARDARLLALMQPPRREVVSVARAPPRLPLALPPPRARARTRPLPSTYPSIRTEPPVTLAARTRLGHAPIVIDAPSPEVDCFCRADPD